LFIIHPPSLNFNNMTDDIRQPDDQIVTQLVDTVLPSAPLIPENIELNNAIEESRRMADEMEYLTALKQIAEFELTNKQELRRKMIAPIREKIHRLVALGDKTIAKVFDELEIAFETYILNDCKIQISSEAITALSGIRLTEEQQKLISTMVFSSM